MGALCRASPTTTERQSNTNSTTNTNNTYTPTGLSGMNDIFSRLQQVAGREYNPFQGQLIAGLTPEQLAGIGNVNNAAGMAQPYFDRATGMAQTAGSPISAEAIERYQNPFTQQVVNATQAQFNENNKTQQSQLRGNAALRGALGGDRAGIAGAELARNQKLAQDPVIANLYQNSYTNALGAAQGDRSAAATGAQLFGNIGAGAQNSAIAGGNAQIAAGGVQQQNNQNKLGANYQQWQNAQAYPYQNAQFLASLGLPVLQGMGGNTTGTSNTQGTTNATETTTPPQASPFSQALGLGMTGLGLFTGNPFMSLSGIGNMFSGNSTGVSHTPNSYSAAFPMPFASGGRIPLPRPRQPQSYEEILMREDPFYAYPKGERIGMRDLSSLTQTFGEKPWREPEPRRGGMVNAFNEWLDRRFYDDNGMKWKDLQEQGVKLGPVGMYSGVGDRTTPIQSNPEYNHPLAPLAGFADGGFVDTVKSFRKMLSDCYAEGGVILPYGDDMKRYQRGIQGIESSGRYDALGPMTRKGDQALGAYQIMGSNLPSWSKEATGREVSREEFLKSKELQDQIFNHRFGQYVNKYGPEGASRAWFAGEKGMKNPNARDQLGTSVADYGAKFSKAIGLPSDSPRDIPQGDRSALASMAGDRSPIMVEEGGNGMKDAFSRKALALGISLLTGGGTGFARGGEIPFEERAEGAFSPFRVEQAFEDVKGSTPSPYSLPTWHDEGATGQKMEIGNPFGPSTGAEGPPEAPKQLSPDQEIAQEDRRDTNDEMTSQNYRGERVDPYQVMQQNMPQGSSRDDFRSALIAAGLGMMAGKSPNALTNIGEGGLKGLQQYNVDKKQRESAELAARRLMQNAEQFNAGLDLRERQFGEQMRRTDISERRGQQAEERRRAEERWKPVGFDENGRPILVDQRSGEFKVGDQPIAGKVSAPKLSDQQKAELKVDQRRLEDLRKEADTGRKLLATVESIEDVLPRAYTGLTGRAAGLVHGDTQTLQARINELSLDLAQKMKGSLSDKDIVFLKSMTSGNWSTPDAIKANVEAFKAAGTRSKLRAQFYEDYMEQSGSLKGADKAWDRYNDAHPLFVQDKNATGGRRFNKEFNQDYSNFIPPKVGTVKDGFRFKGGDPANQSNWEKV